MPIKNPTINAEGHERNIETVYVELGGKAEPGVFGWNREWSAAEK
jgi:hypothetical protein